MEFKVTVDGETNTWSTSHFDYALADFLSRGFGKEATLEQVK